MSHKLLNIGIGLMSAGVVGKTKIVKFPSGHSTRYIYHACVDCGKERWVQLKHGEPISLRCSACGYKIRGQKERGEFNPNWSGGRFKINEGYIRVWIPPDDFFRPMANRKGYVLEHRLVVAKALGRCLHLWEIVHHKGAKYPKGSKEDKADNRYPENLQLVTDDRHKQITILETRIKQLENRVTLLEAENIVLRKEMETLQKWSSQDVT